MIHDRCHSLEWQCSFCLSEDEIFTNLIHFARLLLSHFIFSYICIDVKRCYFSPTFRWKGFRVALSTTKRGYCHFRVTLFLTSLSCVFNHDSGQGLLHDIRQWWRLKQYRFPEFFSRCEKLGNTENTNGGLKATWRVNVHMLTCSRKGLMFIVYVVLAVEKSFLWTSTIQPATSILGSSCLREVPLTTSLNDKNRYKSSAFPENVKLLV